MKIQSPYCGLTVLFIIKLLMNPEDCYGTFKTPEKTLYFTKTGINLRLPLPHGLNPPHLLLTWFRC